MHTHTHLIEFLEGVYDSTIRNSFVFAQRFSKIPYERFANPSVIEHPPVVVQLAFRSPRRVIASLYLVGTALAVKECYECDGITHPKLIDNQKSSVCIMFAKFRYDFILNKCCEFAHC